MSNGFNPMLWNCEQRGCFNRVKRPKIEVFAEDLPGKIAVSDVDGVVEIAGHFLFLEFKSHTDIPRGQSLLFKRLTKLSRKVAVLVIVADAETMICHERCVFYDGKQEPWQSCDLQDVKEMLRDWVEWVHQPKNFAA